MNFEISVTQNKLIFHEGAARSAGKILAALSEIFSILSENDGLNIGADASYGVHCFLEEIAQEAKKLNRALFPLWTHEEGRRTYFIAPEPYNTSGAYYG